MEENKKKGTVKMSSIARKISVSWNFRKLFEFLLLDIILAFVNVTAWRIFTEAELFGRSFADRENFELKGRFVWKTLSDPLEFIEHFRYSVPGMKDVDAGKMLAQTAVMLGILVIAELFFAVRGLARGGHSVRKKLRPLDRLAETAQLISTSDFDINKFHDLEDALEKIDAQSADAVVETGNTELQGIESAINNLIRRMRKSYLQQARFVSDASHELRTPISVIQGYANMLDRWGKDDESILDESINAIKSEADSMSKLVEQLLFLARGDNGRNQLVMENVDLVKMMTEIYEEYTMVDEKHKYRLNVKAEDDITAYGDYTMLKQTARILVDNAVKYTPDGEEIIVGAAAGEDGVPYFEVQDYGNGIAPEDLPKVFERFYRSDDARNRKTGGTGLGLSIAKWIVDRHKGYFNVTSCLDVGSRFAVFLPEKEPVSADGEKQNGTDSAA